MNQTEQMRQTVDRLLGEIVCLELAIAAQDPWSELELRVRDMKKIAEQALSAEPAPLVRLTDAEISKIEHRVWANTIDKGGLMALFIVRFAKAIMDAMQAKNGGK